MLAVITGRLRSITKPATMRRPHIMLRWPMVTRNTRCTTRVRHPSPTPSTTATRSVRHREAAPGKPSFSRVKPGARANGASKRASVRLLLFGDPSAQFQTKGGGGRRRPLPQDGCLVQAGGPRAPFLPRLAYEWGFVLVHRYFVGRQKICTRSPIVPWPLPGYTLISISGGFP